MFDGLPASCFCIVHELAERNACISMLESFPMTRYHLFLTAAVVLAVANGSLAQGQFRIDASGVYVCPPVDRTISRATAEREHLVMTFDEKGEYIGANRGPMPPGPCHAPEIAAAIDRGPLPLCPSTDTTYTEQEAYELREPHLRLRFDLQGRYVGVMHDTPDGPCRPRRMDEESLPNSVQCEVFVVGTRVSMGRFVPVSCRVWKPMADLAEKLNEHALATEADRLTEESALAAQRRAAEWDRLRQEELTTVLRLLAEQHNLASTGTMSAEQLIEQQQRQSTILALQQIGFSLTEISEQMRRMAR